MPPTIQSVSVGVANEFGTITCPVTVNAGSNLAIVAAIHVEAASDDCSAITRDGQSLVEHGAITANIWSRVELWKLANPNLGLNTLSAAVAGAGTDRARLAVWVLENVDQATILRAIASNWGDTGLSSSIVAPSVVSTDLVIDALTLDATGHSALVGALQNSRYNTTNGASSSFEMAGSDQAGSDGGTMSWSWGTSCPFSHIAAAVIEAPPVMQQMRPDADLDAIGWISTPLWSKINEAVADGTVITGVAL